MRKLVALMLILVLVFSLIGCASSENDISKKESDSKVSETIKEDPIKIEDLDWKVSDGIFNGNRMLVFDYTNNSKYTVADFVIKFKLKEDVTDEQLSIFNEVKTEAGWTDEEVKNVYVQGYNHKVSEPGEELTTSPLLINGTFRPATDMAQYNIMEPDMATIIYMKGDKIYSMYYDFATKTYTKDSKGGVEAFAWPTTEIAKVVPKPDLEIGQLTVSDEKSFFFTGYGTDEGFFEDYIEKCKEAGYIFESSIDGWMYEAKHKDGYKLTLIYDSNNEQMTINLEKVDAQ